MGISHSHGMDISEDLLGQIRRMVALTAASKAVAPVPYADERVLEIAKKYEDYLLPGSS